MEESDELRDPLLGRMRDRDESDSFNNTLESLTVPLSIPVNFDGRPRANALPPAQSADMSKESSGELRRLDRRMTHESIVTVATRRAPDKKEIEITVGDLIRFITKDVHKTRQYKSLPLYLIFLASLMVVLWPQLEGEESPVFYRNSSSKRDLNTIADDFIHADEPGDSKFHSIDTTDDFWGWADETIAKLWPSGTRTQGPLLDTDTNRYWIVSDPTLEYSSPNIPLGFLLLRQFRVEDGPCQHGDQLKALPSWLHSSLSKVNCSPSYSRSTVTVQDRIVLLPNGSQAIERSNVNAVGSVTSIQRTGVINTYDSPSKAYTKLLDFNQTLADGQKWLATLKDEKWIDVSTKAILVEVISYNEADSIFVLTSLLLERLPSNTFLPSVKSIPFKHLTLDDTYGRLLFTCDIFILAFVLYDFCIFVYRLKSDQELHLSGFLAGIGGWGVIHCFMLGLYFITYYYRVVLWYESMKIDEDYFESYRTEISIMYEGAEESPEIHQDTKYMWYKLATYAYYHEQCFTLLSACTILTFLRLFSFVQYHEQLNILTETINIAVGDLFGVVLLGTIITVAFAIGMHLLYGDDIEEYKHLQQAVGTLLQTLVSGECAKFEEMVKLHRTETRILVFCFYILAWLVLLNMILAIITGSFASVQDASQMSTGWNLQAIYDSVKASLQGKMLCTKRPLDSKAIAGSTAVSDDKSSDSDGNEDTTKTKRYIQNRIKAVKRLRHAESTGQFDTGRGQGVGGSYVVEQDFVDKVVERGHVRLSRKEVETMFQRASQEVSASNQLAKQGERWAQGITDSLQKVDELAAMVQSLIKDAGQIPIIIGDIGTVLEHLASAYDIVSELDDISNALKEDLDKATDKAAPIAAFSQQLKQMKKDLEECTPQTKKVMRQLNTQTSELKPVLDQIGDTVERTTTTLVEEIKRGTLWGPPTEEEEKYVIPRLAEQSKGRGPISVVQKYRYPVHYAPHQDVRLEDTKRADKSVTFGLELDVVDERRPKGSRSTSRDTTAPKSILKNRSPTIDPQDL